MRLVLAVLLSCTSSGTTVPTGPLPGPAFTEPQIADLTWAVGDVASMVTVSWTQTAAAEAWVAFEVDGSWRETPRISAEAGPQEALLLGIPYGTEFDFRVGNDFGDGPLEGAVQAAATGPLPAGLPVPTLHSSDPTATDPDGAYLIGSINSVDGGWTLGAYWMFAVDRQGRVVWAHPGIEQDYTTYLHVTGDGHLLWDQATYWSRWDAGAGSTVHRMKLDGSVTESTTLPGLHHAYLELPDGSIVWGAASLEGEDLMRHHPDGSTETIWSCIPFYAGFGFADWCFSNAIWHDPDAGTLLVTYPTDHPFVIELELDGTVVQTWGDLPGAWTFDPPESAFHYPHAASFTDAGTLLLSSHVSPSNFEGVVREYALDDGAGVLRQVWTHGAGSGIAAEQGGEARRLPSGNTLHNLGTTPRVREITPGGDVVWDLAWEGERLLGRTVWVDDLYPLAPE